MLLYSLIGSILLYGLNTIDICGPRIRKLQTFYSGRIRFLLHGRYEDQKEQLVGNQIIRNIRNILTIGSKLEYYKIQTYITWGSTIRYVPNPNGNRHFFHPRGNCYFVLWGRFFSKYSVLYYKKQLISTLIFFLARVV